MIAAELAGRVTVAAALARRLEAHRTGKGAANVIDLRKPREGCSIVSLRGTLHGKLPIAPMGDKLKNSPLLEALCSIQFEQIVWDSAPIGAVRQVLAPEFGEQASTFHDEVEINIGPLGAQPSVKRTERLQLKRPDGTAMVQLAPGALVVNHLRPYDSWEIYAQLIMGTLKTYLGATGCNRATRVGLRYINHLPLEKPARVRDLLTTRPPLTGVLEGPMTNFYQRYDLVQDDIDAHLVHQTGTAVANGVQGVILDLDLSSRQPIDVSIATTMLAWLDRAHDRIEAAFHASITDQHMRYLRGV